MAAGLGFKTFTTGEVLSAADTNGYLMQGVLVFADVAARTAAIASPQEGQTCYLKDTDVIQVYSGSTWVTKSGGSSPLTTKGDLYTFGTGDTRLGVGANGTTLVADSSEATGLKWATPASGGMSLLSTTTLSGASVSITNISQDFIKLFVLMIDAHGNDVASDLQYTFNSDTTGGNYYSKMLDIFNAGIGNSENFSTGHFGYGRKSRQNTQLRKLNGYLTLHNYTSTGTKFADILNTSMTEGTNTALVQGGGIYIGGSAISSIQVKLSAGTFTDGSVLIFGVK